MRRKDILKEVLRLEPAEKFQVVEGPIKSHDEPDNNPDELWIAEAERRLAVYRDGKLRGIPMEIIFASVK